MSSKSGIRNVLLATKPCTVWTSHFHMCSEHGVSCRFWLGHVLRATVVCTFWTSQPAKVVFRHRRALYMLTSKCAHRQRALLFEHLTFHKCCEHGVFCTFWFGNVLHATTMYIHFLKLSTYKSAQALSCLCILTSTCTSTPQRRARFEHLSFHNCSEHGVFCTFCLWHVLRAAAPCTFWTFQLPKVARQWTPYLPRWLGTRRFTEAYFSTLRSHKTIGNTVLCDFSTCLSSFFCLSLNSSHLCSSICPYCRKFDF